MQPPRFFRSRTYVGRLAPRCPPICRPVQQRVRRGRRRMTSRGCQRRAGKEMQVRPECGGLRLPLCICQTRAACTSGTFVVGGVLESGTEPAPAEGEVGFEFGVPPLFSSLRRFQGSCGAPFLPFRQQAVCCLPRYDPSTKHTRVLNRPFRNRTPRTVILPAAIRERKPHLNHVRPLQRPPRRPAVAFG